MVDHQSQKPKANGQILTTGGVHVYTCTGKHVLIWLMMTWQHHVAYVSSIMPRNLHLESSGAYLEWKIAAHLFRESLVYSAEQSSFLLTWKRTDGWESSIQTIWNTIPNDKVTTFCENSKHNAKAEVSTCLLRAKSEVSNKHINYMYASTVR